MLIGVDGLEWRLVIDMMKQGRLPQLQRLMRDGTFARLSTLEPALSPPIWTSIATGVLPERHGILGFIRPGLRDPGGQPLLFTNRERRVKAIWNIAGDAGVRSCVIGYWMTFPVEAIDGVMVAQTGAPPGSETARTRKGGLQTGMSGQVHPPELEERVFALAADSAASVATRETDLYGDASAWPAAMKRVVEHSRWSLAADTAYQRIALDLVREAGRCDLVIVYLGLPDVLGHRFWRWTYPDDFAVVPAAHEVASFGDVLPRAYAQIDAFVGEMRSAAGDGAAVLVASDHGMGPWRAKARIDLSDDDGPLLRTGGHSAHRDAFIAGAGPGMAHAPAGVQRPMKSSDATNVAEDVAAVPDRATSMPLAQSVASVARAGSILDMTPTLLALLGLARGADMDGHVASGLLDPQFAARHARTDVASHTAPDWPATRRLAERADLPSAQRLEQFRALGYLQ